MGHGRPRLAKHPPNKHFVAALALQRNASMEALCVSCHRKQVRFGRSQDTAPQAHTHTATQKCHGIKSGHGLGPSTTLNCGALLRQTMQSCCPCFGPRFAGTILFRLFLHFILAGVSFPSSTLLRRACVGSHQGIVLADSRVKILGVCSSPISLSRGVGPCVKPNTHPIPRVSDTLALSLAAASAAREQTHVKHQVHSYLP